MHDNGIDLSWSQMISAIQSQNISFCFAAQRTVNSANQYI